MAAANASLGDLRTWTHHVQLLCEHGCAPLFQYRPGDGAGPTVYWLLEELLWDRASQLLLSHNEPRGRQAEPYRRPHPSSAAMLQEPLVPQSVDYAGYQLSCQVITFRLPKRDNLFFSLSNEFISPEYSNLTSHSTGTCRYCPASKDGRKVII